MCNFFVTIARLNVGGYHEPYREANREGRPMLETNKFARIGYFIVIGVLVAGVIFLSYHIGVYEGDIRVANIEWKFTAGENETLKGLNKQYREALQYYQGVLSKAYTLTQDATLMLKEGTLVIPPVEQQGGDA